MRHETRATGANESRNLIPTSAGKPMVASHGGSGDENVSPPGNFVATELFIDKQQVMEGSIQSLDALQLQLDIFFFFF